MNIHVFVESFFFIASFYHLCVKIIPLDHFYANIDDMTLNLEYWEYKIIFLTDFLKWLENEEKTMICSFFKFSILKHFWSLKLIAWVDVRVVLMFYSFQVIWVDLDREFEKWTKYAQIWKNLKSMLLDFDSLYQWKNSSPPLCVTHIRKGLDLLSHLVCPDLIVWYKNHNKMEIWKKNKDFHQNPLFQPQFPL